jgi:hypothetical protein
MKTRITPQAMLLILLLVTIPVAILGYTQFTLERRNEQFLDSFLAHGMALYVVQSIDC